MNNLGIVQRLTGDYPAAAASLTEALGIYGDIGYREGQAEVLNNLGEVLSRSADCQQARDHHLRALAIAREISAPLEEVRALESLGHCLLRDGNPGAAAAYWQQALTIYQRIGAPDAARPGNSAPARHHHSPAAQRPKPSARRIHRAVTPTRDICVVEPGRRNEPLTRTVGSSVTARGRSKWVREHTEITRVSGVSPSADTVAPFAWFAMIGSRPCHSPACSPPRTGAPLP